jgi:clan AA aspartic protease (TIGR02281 family)
MFGLFLLACGLGLNAAKRLGDDDDGGLLHPDSSFLAGPSHRGHGGGHSYLVQSAPQYAPAPVYHPTGDDPVIRIAANRVGQFEARAALVGRNGREVPVSFLIDTGATHTTLTHAQARAIGISPGSLRYDQAVSTASGREAVASIEIPEIRIFDASNTFWLTLPDVPAYVLRRDVSTGALLGMSALADIAVGIEGGMLTLGT